MRSRANSRAASADHANLTTWVCPNQAVPRCQMGSICSISMWSSTGAPDSSGNTARTASRTAEAESLSIHGRVLWLATRPAYRHRGSTSSQSTLRAAEGMGRGTVDAFRAVIRLPRLRQVAEEVVVEELGWEGCSDRSCLVDEGGAGGFAEVAERFAEDVVVKRPVGDGLGRDGDPGGSSA